MVMERGFTRRESLKLGLKLGAMAALGATFADFSIFIPKAKAEATNTSFGLYYPQPWERTRYYGSEIVGDIYSESDGIAEIFSKNSFLGVARPDKEKLKDTFSMWYETRDTLGAADVPRLGEARQDTMREMITFYQVGKDGVYGYVSSDLMFYNMPLEARTEVEGLFQRSQPKGSEMILEEPVAKDAINSNKAQFYPLVKQNFTGKNEKSYLTKINKWEKTVDSLRIPIQYNILPDNDFYQGEKWKVIVNYFDKKGTACKAELWTSEQGTMEFARFFQRYIDGISGHKVLGREYGKNSGLNILGLPIE
jgi:hypothetical protein